TLGKGRKERPVGREPPCKTPDEAGVGAACRVSKVRGRDLCPAGDRPVWLPADDNAGLTVYLGEALEVARGRSLDVERLPLARARGGRPRPAGEGRAGGGPLLPPARENRPPRPHSLPDAENARPIRLPVEGGDPPAGEPEFVIRHARPATLGRNVKVERLL